MAAIDDSAAFIATIDKQSKTNDVTSRIAIAKAIQAVAEELKLTRQG